MIGQIDGLPDNTDESSHERPWGRNCKGPILMQNKKKTTTIIPRDV